MQKDTENNAVSLVLELDEALRTAQHDRDFDTVERRYAPEYTINSPAGRIQSRQETIDFMNTTAKQTDVERTIEAAYSVGEVVIIMGKESLVWEGLNTELDGRRTARRFTNVWLRVDDDWRCIARQATTVPLDR